MEKSDCHLTVGAAFAQHVLAGILLDAAVKLGLRDSGRRRGEKQAEAHRQCPAHRVQFNVQLHLPRLNNPMHCDPSPLKVMAPKVAGEVSRPDERSSARLGRMGSSDMPRLLADELLPPRGGYCSQ